MRTILPIDNGDPLAAIRAFLKALLRAKVVDALVAPVEIQPGAVSPMLVTDAERLDAADPLAPVLGFNAARAVSAITRGATGARLGVILRSCELRALIELVKLKQASLDGVVTISLDCAGTYDVADYAARALQKDSPAARAELWRALYDELGAGRTGMDAALRDACQMCEKPHAEGADIALELFGADLDVGIPITLPDEMASKLGLTPVASDDARAKVLQKIVAARTGARDERFGAIRERLQDEGIDGVFAACVRCHNCMTVCPICYCKTCIFHSPLYDHEPMDYARWAQHKGAYRMPADTMLFHLTRLNHMVLSCIGCGLCTSGCPADLPVGLVFRAIGHETQERFDYVPGRAVDEPLPLITFREEEWMEVGEQ